MFWLHVKNAQKHFRCSVTSPHPTAKPSWGWLRVGVRKPRLVLVGIIATCNKVTAKARAGVLGCTPHGGAGAIPCAAPYGVHLRSTPPSGFPSGPFLPIPTSHPWLVLRAGRGTLAGGAFSRNGLPSSAPIVIRFVIDDK